MNKKPFYKKWWGVGIIGIVTLFAFPFVIGGLSLYLTHKNVSAAKPRLALSGLILIPTLFFGTAWVAGLAYPSSLPKDSEVVVQADAEDSAFGNEAVEEATVDEDATSEPQQEVNVVPTPAANPAPEPKPTPKPEPEPEPAPPTTINPTNAHGNRRFSLH